MYFSEKQLKYVLKTHEDASGFNLQMFIEFQIKSLITIAETGKQVVGCFCALIFLFIIIGVIVWVSLGSLEGGDLAPDAAADAATDAADAATDADTASTSS